MLVNHWAFIKAVIPDNAFDQEYTKEDRNRLFGVLIWGGMFTVFILILHKQVIAKNHLLFISFRMNQDYQEEVFFIFNSIEAAMIQFENNSAKYINKNLINLLQGSISKDISRQLLEKDLHFSSGKKPTEKLNNIFNNINKKKIFRVYQTPQQLEKIENRGHTHATSHNDNKKASSDNDGSVMVDKSMNLSNNIS
jgi:hypothetical protein